MKRHVLAFIFLILAPLVGSSMEKDTPVYIKAVYSPPLTLDPIKMVDTASLVAGNLIYEGLLEFTPLLEIRGALAESWTTSTDGKTLTFKLKKGATFHDGSPVTAEDVAYSLTRTLGKDSQVYKYYDCIEGADLYFQGKTKTVSGLKVIDPTTIQIKLNSPFPPFLSILAGGTAKVFPKKLAVNARFFSSPIGAGPFKFVRIAKDKGITDTILERFSGYHARVPHIKTMILRSVDEAHARKAAVSGEMYDLANWPLSGNEEVFKIGRDVSSPVAATWVVGLNTKMPPFNEIDVRRAFRASIPTEEFRSRFYPDAFEAFGYIPRGVVGYRASKATTEPQQYTISKTKIRIAFPEVLAEEKAMRAMLNSALKKKGWNAEFVPMEWSKIMKGYTDKTLQGFVMSMNMDYPDPEFLVRNFESENPDNFSSIHDTVLDSLIKQARKTNDRVERAQTYEKINARLDEVAVTVNFFHPRAHNWTHSCVRDFESNILSDYYIDYRTVWVDQKCLQDKAAIK